MKAPAIRGRDYRFWGAFALGKLAVQLAVIGGYGWFRDELYYVACSEHLAWGYVDHPPLSIFLLWLWRALVSDSLPLLRLLPALAGAAVVFLTGSICARLGGGRFAQALAMLAVIVAPVFLYVHHVFSMNAFDVLFWTLASAILVRIFDGGDRRLWIVLGGVLGLGLLNKLSVLWYGFGLVFGLRFSRQRGWYMTPWPWLAGSTAFLLFAPHVVWQVAHGWPTLEFMRNAIRLKMLPVSPLEFLLEQGLQMNPVTAPVWIAGVLFLLFAKDMVPYRAFAILYLVVLALLAATRGSRASYLAPVYPLLFAAGGVAIGRGLGRWPRLLALATIVLAGAVLAPFGLPILPVETFARYAAALGLVHSTDERQEMGALPQHYADMFGWKELVAEVARAHAALPPSERAEAAIFAQNYGEAGAIDLFGPAHGLPRALSGHNSYWYWGPGHSTGEVTIVIGGDEADNREECRDLERVGTTRCTWCMPYENELPIWVCRGLLRPLPELWPRLRRLI